MAQFIDSHWNALWTIKIERMTLRTALHFLVIAHENLDYEVLNYWPCLALTSCPKTVGVTETYRHIHQTQGPYHVPGSVLGVEIAKLTLSPFSSLSPSVWICTNSCLFLTRCGETGASWPERCSRSPLPSPRQLFASPSSSFSAHSSLYPGWGRMPHGGRAAAWFHRVRHFSSWHSYCIFLPRLLFHSVQSLF